ncbi:metallophosphoesterase [Stigmatella aurantiaca]|uniref:Bis(5'-nucleosyl)-tetraphosphatase (Asymmetrical) n=1 Tax=Stigmatella aurantiaca (strain DW4/3-1) TaxID=378806 RepID=Q097S7_STIAD|nr:metallophosphoesterase [Stigmatella aurantiaca]ADO68425.1 Bis(5'-nucleosyl)-tetraphosphatase (Asymmetrical) [Stigmatella aurantiaca DW4/3-1]EAU67999.1 Ser/Thr protein phosphatase family protein [Stigmatella aurantiaca DW4/3-1]
MRTLFIGDVHGCAEELDALLAVCGWQPGDRVVLVGDLVAKGPDSAGVLARARERGLLAVRGNHDEHVLRWHQGYVKPGKKLKPQHQQVMDTLAPEDWAYLASLPLYLRLPEFNVVAVHAGMLPGVPLESQHREHLLNLRSITRDGTPSKRVDGGEPWASHWRGPELVLFGHDAMRGIQRYPHALGLDSGCVYGGRLTAYVLPEGRFYSVPARRAYMDATL